MVTTLAALLLLVAAASPAPQYGGKSRGPKPTKNLLEMIHADPELSVFSEALRTSGLESRLSGADFFTVFAPRDEALQQIDIEEEGRMEQLVSRHLVPGFPRRRIDLAAGETSLVSLGGEAVRVVREGARLEVGEAEVVTPDIIATNGVLHVLDTVLD